MTENLCLYDTIQIAKDVIEDSIQSDFLYSTYSFFLLKF